MKVRMITYLLLKGKKRGYHMKASGNMPQQAGRNKGKMNYFVALASASLLRTEDNQAVKKEYATG